MPATMCLGGWLEYLERIHPSPIELGLERVAEVKRALGNEPEFPIITVGGTNGKGSVCAMLEAALSAAGYRVGVYTSPHLYSFNERVRVAGREASDESLCAAFAEVERRRSGVPLTYFEFSTLAAMLVFRHRVDVAVLEVGLGGRLDAVNAFDADCAIISSVAIDHAEYLGADREQIGLEKAGIFRPDRPAVCAERQPTLSIARHAERTGAHLLQLGRDFDFERQGDTWSFQGRITIQDLPLPGLIGGFQFANASACIAALGALRNRLPVSMECLGLGLASARLPGRCERIAGSPETVLDVAHNPHAAAALAESLRSMPVSGKTRAVFGIMADKDIAGVVEQLKDIVDEWQLCQLPSERTASTAELAAELACQGIVQAVSTHDSPEAAYRSARAAASPHDRLLVVGSFLTVGAVMRVSAAEPVGALA